MKYALADSDTLHRYLQLLFRSLVKARARAYSTDPALAELLDAIHNIPDLLTRWPQTDEQLIIGMLEDLGEKHPEWADLARLAKAT